MFSAVLIFIWDVRSDELNQMDVKQRFQQSAGCLYCCVAEEDTTAYIRSPSPVSSSNTESQWSAGELLATGTQRAHFQYFVFPSCYMMLSTLWYAVRY